MMDSHKLVIFSNHFEAPKLLEGTPQPRNYTKTEKSSRLEHVDAILKAARLAGYLHIRTRWTALPGEPPIIEDIDVDDWLPRFVVLHGSCLFFYLQSTDLSPQDTTMLANVVEVGPLPSFQQGEETHYAFYIFTSHGLRFECSSLSKIQIDMWEATLRADCNLDADVASEACAEVV